METRRIKIDKNNFDDSDLAEAAKVVMEGGLVAFPTETVYGIGVDAYNPDAVNRLCEVKCRPKEKPLSFHIGCREDVYNFTDNVPPMAERLMDRFWPGPLTIIFPGQGTGIGIRFPANAIAQSLIKLTGVPMAVPSANISGDTPAVNADEVAKAFSDKIDLIVDGGPTELKSASTVVRVSEDGFEILREGIITAPMIKKLASVSVLFVCTGNSCRSPMAEALMKLAISKYLGVSVKELPRRGYRVSSAGTSAIPGGRASRHAVTVIGERGQDISAHAARNVTKKMLEESDLVYVLSRAHTNALLEWGREYADKIKLLAPGGVPDPIGYPLGEYRWTADLIDDAIGELLPDVILEEKGSSDETDDRE